MNPNHGTPSHYSNGCRCGWCLAAWAAYKRGAIRHPEPFPKPITPQGVAKGGPMDGARFPAASVFVDVAGELYASWQQPDPALVTYRHLGPTR